MRIAALCREAVQAQRDREHGVGYGLDDYSEGRIVGAANLARKLLRAASGDDVRPAAREVPDQCVRRRRSSLIG